MSDESRTDELVQLSRNTRLAAEVARLQSVRIQRSVGTPGKRGHAWNRYTWVPAGAALARPGSIFGSPRKAG